MDMMLLMAKAQKFKLISDINIPTLCVEPASSPQSFKRSGLTLNLECHIIPEIILDKETKYAQNTSLDDDSDNAILNVNENTNTNGASKSCDTTSNNLETACRLNETVPPSLKTIVTKAAKVSNGTSLSNESIAIINSL